MTAEEYQATQHAMLELARSLADSPIDLDGFVESLDRADLAGPVYNAQLWQQARMRMQAIRRMAIAMKTFQEAARAFQTFVRTAVLSQGAEGGADGGLVCPDDVKRN